MLKKISVSLMAAGLAASALAGGSNGNGATPTGKPFVQIQGQMVEIHERIDWNVMQIADIYSKLDGVVYEMLPQIQDSLDELDLRMDTLEGRVAANEAAIGLLQAENEDLWTQIYDLIDETDDINYTLQGVLDDLQTISEQIEALQDQAGDNTDAINALIAESDAQWELIYQNVDGIAGLKTTVEENAMKIFYLQKQVVELRTEMRGYHGCPVGITPIETADGNLICDAGEVVEVPVPVTVPGGKWITVRCGTFCWEQVLVPGEATGSATCPDGSILLTGRSEPQSSLVSEISSGPVDNAWVVTFQNTDSWLFPHEATVIARCLARY